MYAEPIESRIDALVNERMPDIVKLFNYGWDDKSIANYFGSDRLTVKRIRRRLAEGTLMIQ